MKSDSKVMWLSWPMARYASAFGDEREQARQATLLIGVFYFLVFTTSVQTFSTFYQFPDWTTLLASHHLFTPVWSSRWLSWVNWEVGVRSVLLLNFLSALLGVVFWQRWRWTRVLVFFSIFQYLSLISSFGKIDHYMHLMVIATFMLIFLPSPGQKTSDTNLLRVFTGIGSFILLTYFVSGIFKFYGIAVQEFTGENSALSPDALAQNVAKTTMGSGIHSFFGQSIIDNPSLIFSVLLICGYLVELLSVVAIFYPALRRAWGLLLVLLHATILMTVGPDFTLQLLVLGIFIVLPR